MELLEQLELVDVTYQDKAVLLVFLDEQKGEIREVKWDKQVFDNTTKKYIDNEEKAKKCEAWAQEFFGLPFENLAQAIGERRDVYAYDRYNSLYKTKELAKFDMDMVGQIMQVEVSDVEDDGNAILIKFEYEDEVYASYMRYGKWLEAKRQYFVNPIQRTKVYEKFEDKFAISVENKAELIGQSVMIEIKKAFTDKVYIEVKPFPKKKKN